MHNDSVANYARRLVVDEPGGQQMKLISAPGHLDRVPSIGSALGSGFRVRGLGDRV